MMNGFLSVIPDGWNSTSMVAKKLETSVSTIRRMERTADTTKRITPDGLVRCGKTDVKVYSDGYLSVIREKLDKRHAGRPPSKTA